MHEASPYDVDVVVPTLGRPSLRGLLDVLAAAGVARRIILVDDRRARDDAPLSSSVPAALRDSVIVLRGPHRGPAAARNVGWRAARSQWVLFLDDDVVPQPGWGPQLRSDLAALDDDVAACQAKIQVRLPAHRRHTDWERNVGRLDGARWVTADLAVRRDVLVAIGGFDERFPRAYREDADLSLRISAAGWRLTEGERLTQHLVLHAPWWVSLRTQAGNADDVLMAALHGRDWQGQDRKWGRLPRHLLVTLAGAGAVGAVAAGAPWAALAAGATWTAGTAELAWQRIAPGPRDPREVTAMVATSVAIPPLATFHWLSGIARRRRLLTDTAHAPRPQPPKRQEPHMQRAPAPPPPPARNDPTRPPLPRSLQVEVTAACNLACRMCLVRYRPPVNRMNGAMPLELFTQLLDDAPETDDVTLQGLGEPLLSPYLLDMVREARRRGIKVGFNTNATLLSADKAAALVEAGLTWLCISLDGATAQTYEGIRDGAQFDRVLTNLRGLVAAKRTAGADNPELSLVFVAMRRNLHELPAVVRLAGELDIRSVSVQNLSHSFDDAVDEPGYHEIRAFTEGEALWARDHARADEVFAHARTTAEAAGVHLHLPSLDAHADETSARRPGCDWPWRAAYVNHDGQVQPCCMVMGADRASFGNAAKDGFGSVWWSDAAQEFRAALLTDDPPEVCRGCSLYRGVF